MRHILLVFYMFFLPTILWAEFKTVDKLSAPYANRVFHPEKAEVIDINCSQPNSNGSDIIIDCELKHTSISYNIEPSKLKSKTDEALKDFQSNFTGKEEEYKKGMQNALCSAREEKHYKDNMLILKSEDPESHEFMTRFLRDVCKSKTTSEFAKSMEKYIIEAKKLETKNCKVASYTLNKKFKYKPTSDGYYWTHVDGPSGDCGTITILNLTKSDYMAWGYDSQVIVSNSDSEFLEESCTVFTEKKVTYNWLKKSYPMNCNRISFGY